MKGNEIAFRNLYTRGLHLISGASMEKPRFREKKKHCLEVDVHAICSGFESLYLKCNACNKKIEVPLELTSCISSLPRITLAQMTFCNKFSQLKKEDLKVLNVQKTAYPIKVECELF